MTALTALKDMPISFPGLFGEWSFNPDPIALHIGHGVYWYGVILALGFLAGLLLCMRQAPKYGLTGDNVLDLVLWAVPCCILGSRVYYVLFNLDLYRDASGGLEFGRMIAIWDGGLAIYGTVIAGALVAYRFSRRRGIPFGALADLCVMGLLLGQIIGRWANFINREAFGSFTDLPWRMRLWVSSYQYIEVHPTFLYESLWNLVGLALILLIVSKGRRFDGENTAFYFLWYGLGRCWIEGLRTDSLYFFGLSFLGEPVRVSQALSFLLALAGAGLLFYQLRIRHASAVNLYVNRLAEEQQAASPEEEQDAPPELEDILETHGSGAGSETAETEAIRTETASDTDGTTTKAVKTETTPDTDRTETEAVKTETAPDTDRTETEAIKSETALNADGTETEAVKTETALNADGTTTEAVKTETAPDTDGTETEAVKTETALNADGTETKAGPDTATEIKAGPETDSETEEKRHDNP